MADAHEDRLAQLQAKVAAFNDERNWRQFHAPKNLTMALAIEAAELMEPFRWTSADASWELAQTEPTTTAVQEEMSDVLIVLLSLANYLNIDLVAAANAKLEKNRERYPVAQAQGRAEKYTVLAQEKSNQ